MRRLNLLLFVALAVGLASCASPASSGGSRSAGVKATVHDESECSGSFVAHDLEHVTTGSQSETTLFDGTGAGVTVDDFDGDGRYDIVLPNLSGATTIHFNQGDLRFAASDLTTGRFRQAASVDVDADSHVDLVLTTGVGQPFVLVGDGTGKFTAGPNDLFEDVAYSISWGDVDGDGDVDIATGSYNAELTAQRDFSSVLGGKSGVTFYDRSEDGFTRELLADSAQALVVRFHDVDGDGLVDLQAGNDLATPDALFLRQNGEWEPAAPFSRTTFSTMSLDSADIDNDGDFDLYATDMHPMADDPATLEAWEPVMEDMEALPRVDEVQAMENVLLDPNDGEFSSRATELGIPHTGWSWSGVFGDLDHDGFVDLYVVNGMESPAMFPNLPGGELIEENQAFRNEGGDAFVRATEWNLGDRAGGRGMAMADLDGDGDLDIVVNNLNSSARVFENQLCGGSAMTVELDWTDVDNRAALGAVVELELDGGMRLRRTVDSNRGYLSSGPPVAHFGFAGEPVELAIRWPDGESSIITDLEADTHIEVTR